MDGEVTVPDARRPSRRWPYAAVRDGLLFVGVRELRIWDPATEKVVKRLPWNIGQDLGPASGDLLVSCGGSCARLRLTNLRTGKQKAIAAPDGYAFEPWSGGSGAFSPDGQLLGVPVRPVEKFEPYQADRSLALVDIEEGRAEVIPGTRVPEGYVFVTWAGDGEQVLITGGDRFQRRVIVAYRLGEERGRELDVKVGDFYGMAAL